MAEKILIVEDRTDTKNMIAFALKKSGYIVLDVDDGEKAVELINAKNIDVVLLDILLPKLSGKMVLKKIREDKKNDKIKVIMITAKKIIDSEIKEYKKIGANGFLLKPFKIDELKMEIDKVMTGKE
jgi:DNA-binding response OmpR family regulator